MSKKYIMIMAGVHVGGVSYGIGNKGRMPWPHIPADMQAFRNATLHGHFPGADVHSFAGETPAVIMGRKTWESLPPRFRPLPGRDNLVLTSLPDLEGAFTVSTIEMAVASSPVVFVMGGKQIYEAFLEKGLISEVWFTEIVPAHGVKLEFDTVMDLPFAFSERPPQPSGLDGWTLKYKVAMLPVV